MDLRERLELLRRFQPAALSLETIGAAPLWARFTALLLVFACALGAAYPLALAPGGERLALAQLKEAELRRAYQRKAAEDRTLSARHDEGAARDSTTAALLQQLPSDVEVPDLLDDITAAAEGHGLVVRSLDLKPERPAGFYAELPMEISVEGGYHEIGAFVSRVAGLPRIVTLHDFDLEPAEPDTITDPVRMHVTARIYRRLEKEESEP